jgi:hypothetical protein
LLGKPEGKKALGRLRRRWDYHVKSDIKEILWVADSLLVTQDKDQWRAV